MKGSRIMWIEDKSDNGLAGPARIGRVTFSKTGRSVYYKGKRYASLAGSGYKANYIEVQTGKRFWISGCHEDGKDALYNTSVEIDEDVRVEYWTEIRKRPEMLETQSFRARGKYNR
ncbi:MAG: hypothetical protein P1U85_03510 [Verrucomicrobiales bacterium]|nr:hypothetical protein [Verrucomicrobiales bacterium]